MTQARIMKFLSYVKKVNEAYHGDVHAGFTMEYRDEVLHLWFNDKLHGAKENRFYSYHTSGWYGDEINGCIYTRHDPDLMKAEKHILRVIREAKDKNERKAVSG